MQKPNLTRFTLAAALTVTVVAFTLLLNSGGQSRPISEGARSEAGQAVVAAAADPLVLRMLDDLRAGRRTESQDQPLTGAPVRLVRAGPDNPVAIGALRIPAIGLRTPMFEGVHEDALLDGPGHWPGTPAPGELGNSVISGHRSTETRPFLYLDRLSKGDVISLTHAGRRYRYAVQFVTVVPEERYVRFVLKQPTGPRARTVTLFACNPVTAHFQRIVVRARAVERGGTA
jgi:sortase A